MSDLKPCPFCGAKAPIRPDALTLRVLAQVFLKYLEQNPGKTPTEQDIIKAWDLSWD